MKRYDVIVIGAGPAGLSAAAEAASHGLSVAVFDENAKPGGQLFKQIHKFFGSKEHMAKIRGFNIGTKLLEEAKSLGVEVFLNAVVMGIYDCKEITVMLCDSVHHFKGDTIIVATGANENTLPFEGWTLPGVMGAGAAQTLMNLHGVKPGNRVIMVGSGNVGLVVSYQLMQVGVQVAAIIDALPRVGGYGVHASKIARMGVPFYLSHTITKAIGDDRVKGAYIKAVGADMKPIEGTEKFIEADTVCMAVGLSPMSQLLSMAGCETAYRGARVPIVNEYYETTVSGVFAAGDVSGIEEASSAMITGKIAGLSASHKLGYVEDNAFNVSIATLKASFAKLHEGMFAPQNKGRTDMVTTDEGYVLSQNLLKMGFVSEDEIFRFPGVTKRHGVHPVIECTQNIPCNPCEDACKFNCIKIGEKITDLPTVNENSQCTGCGMCVAACSGQAIFLINDDFSEDFSTVTMPYEILPYPKQGDLGLALGRDGKAVCKAEVVSLKISPIMDKTALLTIKVPKAQSMTARFFKCEEGGAIE